MVAQRLLLVGLFSLLPCLASCERKAPSIEQCQLIAARVLRVSDRTELGLPQVQAKLEQIAFDCLTAPYDRALFGCLEASSNSEVCLVEFRQRSRRKVED